jgi:two-component sensor histidine kinase
LIGINNRQFMNTENAKKVYQTFSEVYGTGKPAKGLDWEITRKDGTKIYVETSVSLRKHSKGHPIGFRGIGKDITERKQAEEQLNQSLREKEVLLQEIHHRVKNNMQVISSLLKLQAATIEEESLRAPFRESEHRVRAMSLVHEKLYQSKDFTHVPFRDYLTSLIRYLYQSSAPQAGRIELVTEIEELPLTITHAIPCGLIVNELVSNAFTHAFPGERKGTITISLRSPEPQAYELTVSDNGIGLPEAIDPHTTTSLGLHLITILVEDQLKGEITVERTGGTRVRIRFRTQQ